MSKRKRPAPGSRKRPTGPPPVGPQIRDAEFTAIEPTPEHTRATRPQVERVQPVPVPREQEPEPTRTFLPFAQATPETVRRTRHRVFAFGVATVGVGLVAGLAALMARRWRDG